MPTIKSHYQLLEDMFVGVRIPAYSGSARKTLLSTPRFVLFDLGIRHAASGAHPGADVVRADPGRYFEQWVVLELWKRLQYVGAGRLSFYRTRGGAEIDVVVERPDGAIVPVEVKWTQRPAPGDARHVEAFVREQAAATEGFVVCRCPRPSRSSRSIEPYDSIVVYSLNMFGDAVRDLLDPRLRGGGGRLGADAAGSV